MAADPMQRGDAPSSPTARNVLRRLAWATAIVVAIGIALTIWSYATNDLLEGTIALACTIGLSASVTGLIRAAHRNSRAN